MNKIFFFFAIIVTGSSITSCKKDTPPLPDILVNFEAAQQGFDGAGATVKLSLNRASDVATKLTISLSPNRLTYGADFTTEPAAISGAIILTIPAGSTSATLKVLKPATAFFNGDESVRFTLTAAEQPVLLGATHQLMLSFSPIISSGAQLTLEGKTAESPYANVSYVDLSANRQTASDRKLWNIALSGGTDFRVILNQA